MFPFSFFCCAYLPVCFVFFCFSSFCALFSYFSSFLLVSGEFSVSSTQSSATGKTAKKLQKGEFRSDPICTIIARYVAKWGIKQMCLCETSTKGGFCTIMGGSANLPLSGVTPANQTKGQFMNFSQGHSGTKVQCLRTPGQLQGSKTPKPEIPRKNSKITPRAPTPNSLKKTQKILRIPEPGPRPQIP